MARATTGLSYLTFGVVVLGSLIFGVFVLIPQFGQYNNARAQLAVALTQETNNKAFLDNLDLRTEELKKYINELTVKPNKSVEDWLELARIQSILGKFDDAYTSISTAKNLDPVRDDIGQLYYQTKK